MNEKKNRFFKIPPSPPLSFFLNKKNTTKKKDKKKQFKTIGSNVVECHRVVKLAKRSKKKKKMLVAKM